MEFLCRLAIAIAEGRAGWIHRTLWATGERYWQLDGEWWLVSRRIDDGAMRLRAAALQTAGRWRDGPCTEMDIAQVLRRWQRTGHWRRIVALIVYRRPPQPRPARGRRRRKQPPADD